MDYDEARFQQMLKRAWSSVYDAMETSENQGRRVAQKRLKYVLSVLNEIQAGEADQLRLKQMRLRYAREEREMQAGTEAVSD